MEKTRVIRKFIWKEIRDKVAKVNAALANIIDQIDPDSRFPLYSVCYPYGSTIVEEGVFYLPTPEGKIVPI